MAPKRHPTQAGDLTLVSRQGISIERKLLELGEGQVAKAVMPVHELGLVLTAAR
jgi:hypothetical protein